MVGQVTQTSVHRPVMMMFFRPVASMAFRKPGSSHEFMEGAFDDRLAGEHIEQHRPDVTGKAFGLDGGSFWVGASSFNAGIF